MYIFVSTGKFPVSTLVRVFVGTLWCVLHTKHFNLRGHFRGHLRVHSRVHFREHLRERVRGSNFAVRVLYACLTRDTDIVLFLRAPKSTWEIKKTEEKAFVLRCPLICFSPHLLNPHLQHSNSPITILFGKSPENNSIINFHAHMYHPNGKNDTSNSRRFP